MKKLFLFLGFVLLISFVSAVEIETGTILDPTGINLSATIGQNTTVSQLIVYNNGFGFNNTNFTFSLPVAAVVNITSFNYTDHSYIMQINGTNQIINFSIVNIPSNTSVIYGSDVIEHESDGIFSINVTDNTQRLAIKSYNILIMDVYDEQDNTPITGQIIFFELISDGYAANLSSSNYSNVLESLPYGNYEIRYWSSRYNLRSHYIRLTENSQHPRLYLLLNESANYVSFAVEDETGNLLSNATVKVMRYFVNCNCYRVVEMDKSNFEGLGVFGLELYLAKYKILVEYDGSIIYDSANGYKLTESAYTLSGRLLEDTTESFFRTKEIYSSLNFDNDTYVFTYTINDPNSIVDQFCLYVEKHNLLTAAGYETVCSNCLSASTGTVLCNVSEYQGQQGEIVAKGWIHTSTQYSEYWHKILTVPLQTAKAIFGSLGLFLGALIVLVLFFGGLAVGGPTVGIVALDVGLIVTVILGLIVLPIGVLFSFIAFSLFIVHLLGDRQ